MSKENLKIKPVEQELTKEDLRKVNGGYDEQKTFPEGTDTNKTKCTSV